MTRRARVVVTDWTFPDFAQYEAELRGLDADLVVPGTSSPDAFLAEAATADALIHEHLDLTSDIVDRLDHCRVIAHHGKGVDNIAVDAASRRGILVANVMDASLHDASEHVLALLLDVARKVRLFDRAVRAGDWQVRTGAPLYRLHGKTLGLVGFGGIARQVAVKAAALGMAVIVWARRPDEDAARRLGVAFVTLDDVFARADAVSLHLPLTPETAGIASAARIAAMKRTAILINISRGGLVDEVALADALAAGRLFGAALDVLAAEPPPRDHPLLRLENAVVTPHCAWYSEEGRADVERRTAREVARVLRGEWPESLVNPEACPTYQSRWKGA